LERLKEKGLLYMSKHPIHQLHSIDDGTRTTAAVDELDGSFGQKEVILDRDDRFLLHKEQCTLPWHANSGEWTQNRSHR
jgi:hypothetical protein